MNQEKVELLKEAIRFLNLFEDKNVGIHTLEILLEKDPDVEKVLEAMRATRESGDKV